MKKTTLILLLLLLPYNFSYASGDLRDIINITLKNNSEIKAKSFEIKAAKDTVKSIISENLINVEFRYDRYRNKNDDIQSSNFINETYVTEYTINASQKIINPIFYPTYKIANENIQKINNERRGLEQEIILNSLSHIIDYKILTLERRNVKQSIDLAQELTKITKIKKEYGNSNYLDYLNAQQNLLDNQIFLAENEREISNKKAEIEKITSINNIENYEIEYLLTDKEIANLGELINLVETNNIDLELAQNDITIAKEQKKLEQAAFFPEAEIYFNRQTTDGSYSFIDNNFDEQTSDTIGLSVSVPLFKSGHNYFNVSRANNDIETKNYNYQELYKIKKEEITTNYEDLQVSFSLIEQAEKAQEIAKITLKISKQEYLSGKIDFTDLLEAQHKFLSSENEVIRQNLNQYKIKYRILALIGNLTAESFDIR